MMSSTGRLLPLIISLTASRHHRVVSKCNIRVLCRRNHSESRSKVPDALSEPEMVRRLMRSQRVWWWMGGIVLSSVGLVAFGPELKLGMSKHTAEVASRSLQDKTLRDNSRELASQIVQTVLNDHQVLTQASQFLQRLVEMESTREGLRMLVIQTLNNPMTRTHVVDLTKHTIGSLLKDPKTMRQVVDLLHFAVVDPQTKEALSQLLEQIMHDEKMRAALTQLMTDIFMQEIVKETVSKTLGDSVHDVLSRKDVENHAKEFVSRVVQDQTVQAQSGDAIWGTVMYALTPTWLSWVWTHPEDMTNENRTPSPAEVAKVMVAVAAAEDAIEKNEQDKHNQVEKPQETTWLWKRIFQWIKPSLSSETQPSESNSSTNVLQESKEPTSLTASSHADAKP